ncbi:hypothetical protein PR048_014442 [Dryococelus australis]|uniref:Uncharacterized protein n=1 Tax=Dryococelus australis TaxID=614101 RepID=A0ABQ9HE64_9NEOP|nr:hypothetical protein PR048_014442 [Dryococelus australis]
MRANCGESEAGPEYKGRGKPEVSEKTRRPAASPGTIPTCENAEMTGASYICDVVDTALRPHLDTLQEPIFQHDKARPHVGRTKQRALHSVYMPAWPAKSPDLRPIEYPWDMIGWRLISSSLNLGDDHRLDTPRSWLALKFCTKAPTYSNLNNKASLPGLGQVGLRGKSLSGSRIRSLKPRMSEEIWVALNIEVLGGDQAMKRFVRCLDVTQFSSALLALGTEGQQLLLQRYDAFTYRLVTNQPPPQAAREKSRCLHSRQETRRHPTFDRTACQPLTHQAPPPPPDKAHSFLTAAQAEKRVRS